MFSLGDLVVLSEAEPAHSESGELSVMGSFVGRYSLSDLRNGRGDRRIFQCRAVNVSTREIVFAGPVRGKIGDRVIAHIDELGKFQGAICRFLENGFVIKIVASDDERERLAVKIKWLNSRKDCQAQDRRIDKRIVAANPTSKIILSNGTVESCRVLDLSVSGAAISADTTPDIGAVLAIGGVVGRVVRHFGGGFAVRFIERQRETNVESMVILQ
jgi:hypothetical protein